MHLRLFPSSSFSRVGGGPRHLHDFEVSPGCLDALGVGIYGHVRIRLQSPAGCWLPGRVVPTKDINADETDDGDDKTVILCHVDIFKVLGLRMGEVIKVEAADNDDGEDHSDRNRFKDIMVRPAASTANDLPAHNMEVLNRALRGLTLHQGCIVLVSLLGQVMRYEIVGERATSATSDVVSPEDSLLLPTVCTLDTRFCLVSDPKEDEEVIIMKGEGGGGVVADSPLLEELKEWVMEVSLSSTEEQMIASEMVMQVRGILLSGPSGAGKTRLLQNLIALLHEPMESSSSSSNKRRIPVAYLKGGELANRLTTSSSSSDQYLVSLLRPARGGLLLIDDFDELIPPEDDDDVSSSLEASLHLNQSIKALQHVLSLAPQGPLCWIFVTSEALYGGGSSASGIKGRARRLSALQTSLYDRVIEMPAPSPQQRAQILRSWLLPKGCNVVVDDDDDDDATGYLNEHSIEKLSQVTGGFLPGDLVALCEAAALRALLRVEGEEQGSSDHDGGQAIVQWQDLMTARTQVSPAVLSGLEVSRPQGLSWNDFGGYQEVKDRLQRLILWPTKHRESFIRLGLDPPTGILLHGPSGCGKSFLARIVASECQANFIELPATEIFSPYLGDSEARLRAAFARARRALPCILFLDELDSMAAERESGGEGEAASVYGRVLSTLLNEMDGVSGRADGLLVLAATNRLQAVDAALLRPGRLQESLSIPFPDPVKDYTSILQASCKNIPLADDVDFNEITQSLLIPLMQQQQQQQMQLTPAQLAALCREAALESLRENVNNTCVSRANFVKALEVMIAS